MSVQIQLWQMCGLAAIIFATKGASEAEAKFWTWFCVIASLALQIFDIRR